MNFGLNTAPLRPRGTRILFVTSSFLTREYSQRGHFHYLADDSHIILLDDTEIGRLKTADYILHSLPVEF